jgi:ribosome-binding protein aMBF1 (putative translation factor)/adenylate kinase family enzyme
VIKNERQYRITKSQAEKFENAIGDLESARADPRVHPKLRQAQIDALRSQWTELHEELEEYESLRSGKRRVLQLRSFGDLPRALIQARIASGMSQEDLASRLGIKPQQIQRYEATDYLSASLSRVSEVVQTLGVQVQEDVFLPGGEYSVTKLLKKLSGVGLDGEFVRRRLLPGASVFVSSEDQKEEQGVALEAAEGLHRVYGWLPPDLFGTKPLELQMKASTTARFKLPARVREAGLGAYVIYAHYLALLVLQCVPTLEVKRLSTDWKEVRQTILEQYGELSFETALKYVWSLGVPVLPLNDTGAFHGACWRLGGRNVIVLKQRTRSAAKWLHDLLHEYFHAAQNPDLEEHPVIEDSEMSPTRRNSPEEKAASRFAGDVMLEGRAEELAEQCVAAAKNRVELLKNAVPSVAQKGRVQVDALANYMAFRLSLQGINWWGAANNLQTDGSSAMCTPRDFLLQTAQLRLLNPVDRDLLLRALEPLVLGFAGRIGSGKSTLSTEVAKALGWPRASFGDYVRTVARNSGLDESREVLQELGASLIEGGVDDFCRAVLANCGWNAGEPLVIDGIRHAEVIESLRKLVAPLEMKVVYLDVGDDKRLENLRTREQAETEALKRVEEHPTEEQVKDRLPGLADLRLAGDHPVPELVSTLVKWIHQGDGKQSMCAA